MDSSLLSAITNFRKNRLNTPTAVHDASAPLVAGRTVNSAAPAAAASHHHAPPSSSSSSSSPSAPHASHAPSHASASVAPVEKALYYRLNASNSWDTLGTAKVTVGYVQKQAHQCIIVTDEKNGSSLLDAKVQPMASYQKQQENFLVWVDPAANSYVGLFFDSVQGCVNVWEHLEKVQNCLTVDPASKPPAPPPAPSGGGGAGRGLSLMEELANRQAAKTSVVGNRPAINDSSAPSASPAKAQPPPPQTPPPSAAKTTPAASASKAAPVPPTAAAKAPTYGFNNKPATPAPSAAAQSLGNSSSNTSASAGGSSGSSTALEAENRRLKDENAKLRADLLDLQEKLSAQKGSGSASKKNSKIDQLIASLKADVESIGRKVETLSSERSAERDE